MLSHEVTEIELVVSVYFFLDYGKHFSKEYLRTRKPKARNAKKIEPVSSSSRRGARAAYRDEYPRDFGPWITYTVSSVSDTCQPLIRQGEREISAPRPYETYPFHPQSSALKLYCYEFFIYMQKSFYHFFHVV